VPSSVWLAQVKRGRQHVDRRGPGQYDAVDVAAVIEQVRVLPVRSDLRAVGRRIAERARWHLAVLSLLALLG